MTDSRRDDHPDRAGGLPVGRSASEGGGRATRPAPRRARPAALPLIILALVAGLGGGVAIGWFIGHGSREAAPTTTAAAPTTSGETATTVDIAGAYGVVMVSGTGLPALASGETDAAVGLAIPHIEGVGFDGRAHVIGANGKGKLIVALAHWCPYCQQELPILSEWYASADIPDGVEVFLLTVFTSPDRTNFPPGPWLAAEEWTGPVLADDATGSLASALGIVSVPYNLLVSPDGTVAARVTGGLTTEQLDGAIEYLATGESSTTTP